MEKELEVNGSLYSVECLLGKGKGGYSYLVKKGELKYVVKQIHHEPCEYYTFGDKIAAEEKDYGCLKSCGIRIPKLYEIDYENERIRKEYIEGETIYNYVLQDRMQTSFLQQIREMAKELHDQNLNIDYFPTNFVVKEGLLWYIDYECNEYMEEWNFENWGIKYWSKTDEFNAYVKKQSS